MLAGSVSMLFGGILSARSEADLYGADSKREAYEIEHEPEEERWELKNLYRAKGLTEQEAETVVRRITLDKEKWLEDMLVHELHVHKSTIENPIAIGLVISGSFFVGALVPLIPFLFLSSKVQAQEASVLLSLVFLFGAGFWKGRVVKRAPWKGGLETLAIGAGASLILYTIGSLFVFV
jgi:predicted membrane protein (TIGR00267 family)